jgi:flagellar motor protein MotB
MGKEIPEDPPGDIPAWFMTYSDVITLLMTFFILLLTFSTTEPERFEKVTISVFGGAGATGVAGHKQNQLDKDSWSQRVRPRAARIAMQGSEMPPIEHDIETASVGPGLQSVNEQEAKKDVMRSYAFNLPLAKLVDANLNVTRKGQQVASKLSKQLSSLAIHCTLEISQRSLDERVCAFAHYLYHAERARPGQIGTGFAVNVESGMVRIVIEKYESNR